MKALTAYLEWDQETNLYVGFVPGIPGTHTSGEAWTNQKDLKAVLVLCLEEYRRGTSPLNQTISREPR